MTSCLAPKIFSSARSATAVPIELVCDLPPTHGTDPEYDRARQLLAIERAKAGPHLEASVATADEIERLRGLYLKDRSRNLLVGPKAHPVLSGSAEGGFQAKLQTELGLHHEQARRLLERADYVRRLRLAAAGKPVLYITGTGKAKHEETFQPDARSEKIAKASLDAVLAGDLPPSRAWAGVCGEGLRVAATGKKERAAVDPAKQIRDDFRSLGKWLPMWKKLPLEDQVLLARIARDARLPDLFVPVVESIAGLKP